MSSGSMREKAYKEIKILLAEKLSIHESEVPEELIVQTYEALLNEQEIVSEEHTIIDKIEKHFLGYPDRKALVLGEVSSTFKQIYNKIICISKTLISNGVEPGMRVGVHVGNPIERICAILGVMRTRAVVLALDPLDTLPNKKFQLKYAGIEHIICESKFKEHFINDFNNLILIDELKDNDIESIELPRGPEKEDFAYLTVQSDKEVLWTHSDLIERISSLQTFFDLQENEAFALWQTEESDTWLFYSLWPLTVGASLILPSKNTSTKSLVESINEINPNLIFLDSRVLVHIAEFNEPIPDGIRYILTGSEPLYSSYASKILARCNNIDIYFCFTPGGLPLNFNPVKAQKQINQGRLSLGTPRIGRAALLDAQGYEVEEGVVGEIHLWDRNTLVPTGLKAVMSSEGEYRWVENQDKSLALVGHDIFDTNKIYSTLMEYSEVSDAFVLVKSTNLGFSEPVVYVVLKNENIDSHDLYERLRNDLPRTQLFFKIITVNSLPLINGQIDENKLSKLPVISPAEFKSVEEKVRLIPGVTAAETVMIPKASETKRLHISDLLIDHKLSRDINVSEGIELNKTKLEESIIPIVNTKISYLNGGELKIPKGYPLDLATAFQKTAKQFPSKGIHFIDSLGKESFISYPNLLNRAKRILGGLQSYGLKSGDKVILQIDSLEAHFSTFWACILGGILPATVAIAPSYLEENGVNSKIYHTWKLLGKPTVITMEQLKVSMENLEDLFLMDGLNVLTIEKLEHKNVNGRVQDIKPNEVAFFQLTSGSTGAPKCIQEVHEKIIRHIHAASEKNSYEPNDITLNWLQLDHVVPILTSHLKDVYLGCSQVHVRPEFILSNPIQWLNLIQKYKVSHSWSPNFGYKIVSEELKKNNEGKWNLSSLKYLMNAGEQVTASVINEFLDLTKSYGIEEEIMQPAFGMAEVCTCMTYCNNYSRNKNVFHVLKSSLKSQIEIASDSQLDEAVSFVSSGKPVSGVEIRIVNSENSIVPEGHIGRFQIRGEVVMPGYLNNEDANLESFVGDGWFNTGDLGFIMNGELFITGREKELIIIYGANFYCHEIEEFAGQVDGVLPTYVAACGVQDQKAGTESLGIFFVPTTEDFLISIEIAQEIRGRVTSKLGISPDFIIPLEKDNFLKTTSGKIQRDLMKQKYLNGEYNEIVKRIDIILDNENTIPNWFFKKTWIERNQLSTKIQNNVKSALILGRKDGVGGRIASLVNSNGGEAVIIEAGNEFMQLSNTHFIINPEEVERLEDVLLKIDCTPTHIIHAWQVDVGSNSELGLYSLTQLLKSSEKIYEDKSLTCMVITQSAWKITEGEQANPDAAMLTGIIKTWEQERPNSRGIHVDFDTASITYDWIAKTSYKELINGDFDKVVAYRQEKRWVSKLVNVDLTKNRSPIIVNHGGHYLVTGGTRGIGKLIVKMLVEQFEAKVLVLTRSPLNTYSNLLDGIEKYKERVMFIQADLTNLEEIQKAVEIAEVKWKASINGVFHFAGVMEERLIKEETTNSIAKSFAGKVTGANMLVKLFSSRPETFIVMSSSINGYFGGFRAGAYSAANAYLDSLPTAMGKSFPRIYSIAWTQWEEIGMNVNSPLVELSKAKGFMSISPIRGLNSLMSILCQEPGTFYVGIDPEKRYVGSHISLPTENTEVLHCYYSGDIHPKVILNHLSKTNLMDDYNTVFNLDINYLENLPVDQAGAPDKIAMKRIATEKKSFTTNFQEPISITEKKLSIIWGNLLNINRVGVSDNFFELGGHSLLATQLVSRIRSEFEVEVPIDTLFRNPTLGSLAKEIDNKIMVSGYNTSSIPLEKYNNKYNVPLSFAQERLWFLNQLSPGNPFYNIQQMVKIKGDIERGQVERTFKKLAERQAVLRTTFKLVNEIPIQIINDINAPGIFNFKYINLRGYEEKKAIKKINELAYEESQKGFDLEQGPVFRCILVTLNENEHVLMLTLHHIVADAWSIGVLVREFIKIFQSNSLPELEIEYTDFSMWQREWFSGEEFEKQLSYWKTHLAGYNGILELATDYPRPQIPTYKGEKIKFNMHDSHVRELEQLSQSLGVTQYMILLTAFNVLLKKYSNSEDIVVGMPIANRNHTQIEDLIGFFVNTLPIRTILSNNPNFNDLVLNSKDSLLGAYKHQDMPFELLVNELQLERRIDRQPLCQVAFVMQNVPTQDITINGLEFELLDTPHEISKFDLTMSFNEKDGELLGTLEYSTDLFSRKTMERLVSDWNQLIESILKKPEQRISDLLEQIKIEGNLIYNWEESMSLPGVSDEEFNSELMKVRPSLVSVAALTPVQRDLYFDYLSQEEDSQYGVAYSINLGSKINPEKWSNSIKIAMDNTPVLKSRYYSINGTFYQVIDENFSSYVEFNEGTEVNNLVNQTIQEPFNLFEGAVRHILFKNSETGNYTAVLCCHHILLDAYSGNLFFKRVIDIYKVGERNCLIDKRVAFHDLIDKRVGNFDTPDTLEYWRGVAQNIQAITPSRNSHSFERSQPCIETLRLSNGHMNEIKQYCLNKSIGLATYFRGLLGFVLDRFYQPENDFVIYDVRGGRDKQEVDIIGCLYQVSPVLFHKTYFNQGDTKISNIFKQLVEERRVSNKYENLSVFSQRQIFGKDGIRFYTNFYNFPEIKIGDNKSHLNVTESYELDEVHFIFSEIENELEIRLAYDESRWISERFLERIDSISKQILSGCDVLSDLNLVLEDERKLMTQVWNPLFVEEENYSNLISLFNEQCSKNPNSIALSYEGSEITYDQLNRRSNQFSRYLIKKGIQSNKLVGLYLPPSIDSIICILGILKAGGAYLPIDMKYPSERVKFMINDSNTKLIITESSLKENVNLADDLQILSMDIILPEVMIECDENIKSSIDSDQLAYVIYTSGSTGTPKGALLTHFNVIRLFKQTDQWYKFNSNDVWTLFHSVAFDFSVWEIWGALLYGGKLVIVNPLTARSPQEFYDLIKKENVTVLNQTPSAFMQFIQTDLKRPVSSDLSLRYIIFGGEALNYAGLKPWFERYGYEKPQLINMYGITETTVHVTYKPITITDFAQQGSVSNIGIPIPDLQIYILDKFGKMSPVGSVGEMYIGGNGLAKGYLNRPELNAERFITNHIEPKKSKKLYRTGDLGRWLPNGEIEYLGRVDQQVKIRGFRMELGEIESCLRTLPDISDVAVIARLNQRDENELVAYIVSQFELSISKIKEKLKQKLPEYMHPTAFVRLDKLPLTANGKLNRKSLPEPKESDRRTSTTFAKPENIIQELMVKAWQEVLGIDRVGIEDNFYDLGGHSLKLVDLQSKLNSLLDGKTRPIGMIELFQYPTIKALTKYLEADSEIQEIGNNEDMSISRVEKRKQLSGRRRNRVKN